ncbi:MAG: FMN-binding protein [Clostridium sp.]
MRLFFNVLFAWIGTISGVLLSVIWIIRIMQRKMPKGKNKDIATSINKYLRKNHINLGYIFIISSFIHGMLSSFSIISLNYGTLTFIIGLAIGYTYMDKANLGKKWIKYHRQLTLLIIWLTVVHIIEVGGFVGIDGVVNSIKSDSKIEQQIEQPKEEKKEESKEQDSKSKYKDGVYEGVGYGYKPNLKVQVTIKDGVIKEVLIKEHNEVGQRFYLPAFDIIPKRIIEKQTAEVDTVSGATRSSRGIMEAVNDALSKAEKIK